MGKDSKSNLIVGPGEKKPIIHRSKLFKGQKSAQEIHREFGFRERCSLCGGPPVIMVRCLATVADIKAKSPEYWAALQMSAANNPGGMTKDGRVRVPTIATTYGKMIRFSQQVACLHHQKDLEITAAKAPAWVLVEIARGPGADRPLVSSKGLSLV